MSLRARLTLEGRARTLRPNRAGRRGSLFFMRHFVPRAIGVAVLCLTGFAVAADRAVGAGPLYCRYRLTLEPGEGVQALGPLWIRKEVWPERRTGRLGPDEWLSEEQRRDPAVVSRIARSFTIAPLFSWYTDPSVDASFFDFLYPVVTYDRYGTESRFQIFQLISFSGGRQQRAAENERIYTLFPFFFTRRSPDPERRYTAVWPVYGHLQSRLFRDDIRFVLWPLYVRTRKRDVVTDNYVAPFVHRRRGDGLKGWQVWPLIGHERKSFTYRTNTIGELEPVGGHNKWFALWPLYARAEAGFGTTNRMSSRMVLPFYSHQKTPAKESTSYLWPFGVTLSADRQIGYRQTSVIWPFFIRARGPGKHEDRVWPFYGYLRYRELTSRFFLWPVFSHRQVTRETYRKDIQQVALVLYNRTRESNGETGQSQMRVGLWPLFLWKSDWEGRRHFQFLAPLSTLMPKNESIARTYAPFFALWRSEKNAQTGAASQSALWNLYRRETTPKTKKCSLLFGLFQYEKGPSGRRVKLFFLPLTKRRPAAAPRS